MDGFLAIRGRGLLKSRMEGVSKESKKPYRMAEVCVMNAKNMQAFTTMISLSEEQFKALPPDGEVIEFGSDAEPQRNGYGYDARAFVVKAAGNRAPKE